MEPIPPFCTQCKEPCTLFITLVAGGKASQFACCGVCPSNMTSPSPGFLPSQCLGVQMAVPMPVINGVCPSCGFRWEDFERTHRIGCPTCYETHQQELLPTLARIQPGTAHAGRRPLISNLELKNRIAKVKTQLAQAIKEEDYEAAASLRDQIAELDSRDSVK